MPTWNLPRHGTGENAVQASWHKYRVYVPSYEVTYHDAMALSGSKPVAADHSSVEKTNCRAIPYTASR